MGKSRLEILLEGCRHGADGVFLNVFLCLFAEFFVEFNHCFNSFAEDVE